MRRYLVGVMVFLGLGAAMLALPRLRQAPVGSYVTLPARKGDVEVSVLASGVIEPRHLVNVGAQVSGRLLSLNVELGDTVTEGQLIGEIDSVPQTNVVRKAQASLSGLEAQRDRVRSSLRQAQLAFRRQSDILAGRAGTRQDYESAEAAYEGAKADLVNLEAQLVAAGIEVEIARTTLGYTRITAPIDGTVVAVMTKQGQTVISAQIAPVIVKLADLRTMTVKARISEADVIRIKPGQPVTVTVLADSARRYEATLRMIEPAPDQIQGESASGAASGGDASGGGATAVYYNGRFEIENRDGALRPFMTAQVRFVSEVAKDAVLVPSAAVTAGDAPGAGFVRILDAGGQPRRRPVRTGLDTGVDTEIREGVSAGESVVIAGPEDAYKGPREAFK